MSICFHLEDDEKELKAMVDTSFTPEVGDRVCIDKGSYLDQSCFPFGQYRVCYRELDGDGCGHVYLERMSK